MFAVVCGVLFFVCSCRCSLFLLVRVVVDVCWSYVLSSAVGRCCSWLLSVVVIHRLRPSARGLSLLVACHYVLLFVVGDVYVLCWCCNCCV